MDKHTVARLYEKYADTVMRAALNFTGSDHLAGDCTEEAFLRFMRQEQVEQGKELAWLIRTAVNIAKDVYRSAEHRLTVPFVETEAPTVDDGCTLSERAALRAMLSLDENYRLPLFLHLVEGYSIRETARILGKRPNTVASLIHRGRVLLRKAYEKEETL